MTEPTSSTSSETDPRGIASTWFAALTSGDIDTVLGTMAEDVEFINYTPVPGYNDDMPWIGTYRGPRAIGASFGVFVGVCDVLDERLVQLVVDGEQVMGVLHERSRVKETGLEFEIEFVQWLTIRDGRVVRCKTFTDPSEIIRAIRGDKAAHAVA